MDEHVDIQHGRGLDPCRAVVPGVRIHADLWPQGTRSHFAPSSVAEARGVGGRDLLLAEPILPPVYLVKPHQRWSLQVGVPPRPNGPRVFTTRKRSSSGTPHGPACAPRLGSAPVSGRGRGEDANGVRRLAPNWVRQETKWSFPFNGFSGSRSYAGLQMTQTPKSRRFRNSLLFTLGAFLVNALSAMLTGHPFGVRKPNDQQESSKAR